jgi:protein-disulfide isomerase
VDTDRTKPVIDAEIAEARRLGIQGTPTFLINGKLFEARSLDAGEFSRVFDLLLK